MPRMNPLGNIFDIIESFPPVSLQVAANTGDWVNMKSYDGALLVIMAGIGASGEVTITTIRQATSNAGAGAKALSPSATASHNAWKKEAATDLSATAAWSDASGQLSANVATSGAGNLDRINAFWIDAAELDMNNGFYYVQASIADVGSTLQAGACFWICMSKLPNSPANVPSGIA